MTEFMVIISEISKVMLMKRSNQMYDLQFVVKNIEYSFYNVIENYTDRYGIIMAPEIDFLSLLDESYFSTKTLLP